MEKTTPIINKKDVIIVGGLLPALKPTLQKRGRLLFYIGVAWGFLVALSRIIVGAHFVTDTVVGFAITLGILLLVVRFGGVRNKEHV